MTTTTTQSDYLPGEALTGRITAREWIERCQPGMFGLMCDLEYQIPGSIAQGIAEITERGHDDAARFNIPHSPSGAYPAVIWELAAERGFI